MEMLISTFPYIGKKIKKDVSVLRVLVLRRFYIYYEIVNETINIIAFKAVQENQ